MEALDLEKEILISHQPDIDKICLHAKNSYDAKYWFLIKKRDGTGLKHLNDSKDFYWTLKWYGLYLKKDWRIQSK